MTHPWIANISNVAITSNTMTSSTPVSVTFMNVKLPGRVLLKGLDLFVNRSDLSQVSVKVNNKDSGRHSNKRKQQVQIVNSRFSGLTCRDDDNDDDNDDDDDDDDDDDGDDDDDYTDDVGCDILVMNCEVDGDKLNAAWSRSPPLNVANSQFTVRNSEIVNMPGHAPSLLSVTASTIITFHNCTFRNNHVYGIITAHDSRVVINASEFINNTIGSSLLNVSRTSVVIQESLFHNQDYSTAVIQATDNSDVNIKSTTFMKHSGPIELFKSTLQISDSVIYGATPEDYDYDSRPIINVTSTPEGGDVLIMNSNLSNIQVNLADVYSAILQNVTLTANDSYYPVMAASNVHVLRVAYSFLCSPDSVPTSSPSQYSIRNCFTWMPAIPTQSRILTYRSRLSSKELWISPNSPANILESVYASGMCNCTYSLLLLVRQLSCILAGPTVFVGI